MAISQVLVYEMQGQRLSAVRGLCASLKIRLREVPPEEYLVPLSVSAGLEAATKPLAAAEPFPEEMMIMVNFSQELLNRFLQGFHRLHIPPVSLKAILTPTNVSWTAQALYQELSKEREAYRQQENAHE